MPIYKRANGITLFYTIIDETNKSGDYCILLGGLTRDHTIWRKLVPYLKQHYQLIMIDNRDAGQSISITDDYEIADLAEDMIDIMQHLNLPPVHLIGHSMGRFIAQHIAAKQPTLVKSLILCSTSDKQVTAGVEYLKHRIKLIEAQPEHQATTASKEDIIAVMDKLYAPKSLLSSQFVEEIITHETSNPYPQPVLSFKRQALACIKHDASHLLNGITCPVLIVTGEHDPYYTPQLAHELADRFQRSKVAIIPDTAHMVQIEKPEKFALIVKDFISQTNLI